MKRLVKGQVKKIVQKVFIKVIIPMLPFIGIFLIVIMVMFGVAMSLPMLIGGIGGVGAIDEDGINEELLRQYAEVKLQIDNTKDINFPKKYIFAKDVVVRNNDFSNINIIYITSYDFECFINYDEEGNNVKEENQKQEVYTCEGWDEIQITLFEQAIIIYNQLQDELTYGINLAYPMDNYTISAPFNSNDEVHSGKHNGVDFVSTTDDKSVHASQSGEVVATYSNCPQNEGIGSTCPNISNFGGGGNFISIKHETKDGQIYYTGYHHLKEVKVTVGDDVKQGDVIGVQGSSGNSTGDHLHLELRLNTNTFDSVVDPMPYFLDGDISKDKEKLMQQAGIGQTDYDYVDYIVDHESSWNYQATNSSSGAYGLCQALPGNKMASEGEDWKDNPVTQLKWCNSYAKDKYKNWEMAYNFWRENNWW